MELRRGFKLIEVMAVGCCVCLMFAVACPAYITLKGTAREAEVKDGLHQIQLGIERFGIDTDGSYPMYLTGGSASAGSPKASDPLIRRSYIRAYPTNPFMRCSEGGDEAIELQSSLDSSTLYGSDPLRPGTLAGDECGYRFGQDGTLMGSVLADPRYVEWSCVDWSDGVIKKLQTFADVEYDFWDTWGDGNRIPVKRWMPGAFFYKAGGPLVASELDAQIPVLPTDTTQYMLGGYGSLVSPGKDLLGTERRLRIGTNDSSGTWEDPFFMWIWTRSQVGGTGRLEGSPYSPLDDVQSAHVYQYGNPNGIRDSIILILTAKRDVN